MHGHHHVAGPAGDGGIDQLRIGLEQPFHLIAPVLQLCQLFGVAEIGDVRLVQLQVAATGRGEVLDRRGIGGAEVGEEAGHVRIGMGIHRPPPATEMQHGGRGDGLLRHGRAGMRRDEAEILDEGMRQVADRAIHLQPIGLGLAALELDALVALIHLDAAKPGEEVEMPEGAAILAIGNRLQAIGLLLSDRFDDGGILGGAETGGIQRARSMRGAGLPQRHRAQQAADHVGAERRLALGHGVFLSQWARPR